MGDTADLSKLSSDETGLYATFRPSASHKPCHNPPTSTGPTLRHFSQSRRLCSANRYQRIMPKGLIPLMLSSPDEPTTSFGSRSSVIFFPDHKPNKPTHVRRISVSPPVSPAHRRNSSDVVHSTRLSRPPLRTPLRRQSQQVPASLPAIPYSSAEWKKAITEIKRYHVTRRFRACSARCSEILTNIKSTVSTSGSARPGGFCVS